MCRPILAFWGCNNVQKDRTLDCNFHAEIRVEENEKNLIGSAWWRGQATEGRFVRLVFGAGGSCLMFYDTGYRHSDPERGEEEYTEEGICNWIPKSGASSFLSLPMQGDEDLSTVSREEFF